MCHPPVHSAQPGGGYVAHPRHLHRRWFAGEGKQAVVLGVAGQIDQDVDAGDTPAYLS